MKLRDVLWTLVVASIFFVVISVLGVLVNMLNFHPLAGVVEHSPAAAGGIIAILSGIATIVFRIYVEWLKDKHTNWHSSDVNVLELLDDHRKIETNAIKERLNRAEEDIKSILNWIMDRSDK